MRQYVTIKVDEEKAEVIANEWQDYLIPALGEYELFKVKKDTLIITAYKSSQGIKVVFEDEKDILEIARKYDPTAKVKVPKVKPHKEWLDLNKHIGSDEVGTGDFFGPIIVCAAYYDPSRYELFTSLGIADSKALSDQKILEIGPTLLQEFPHSLMICHNDKYNELLLKGFNMNSIKAWLHNEALGNVQKKYGYSTPLYLDEFCSEELYYHYLNGNDHIVRSITFKTKGESYYPAIAIASCIARYTFLKIMQEYTNKFGLTIPLGAGKKVDEIAYTIYQKHGLDVLEHYVKKNFKNYQTLINRINGLPL